ncbi:DUF3179 domain-containing protein [Gymnodinialimonas ceratoperidinii]|uniref:DUF3179 domain-containing protein n=1 Tax=Gymnodinialimonas ceratoperidinii TaxID=2856823 RepID=A0A8F6YBX1_9RHOB|nr:DUF3179 domain-containing protein [Gymnodinialimonas ceratoperidinii]QXT38665.1 DUF3179 domain-containing protein [Gymnodinialimonas ceratoperidinii]
MRWSLGLILGLSLGLSAAAQGIDPTAGWPNTDFSTATVDLSEVHSGGVPRDGIPALDAPRMIPAGEETALEGAEPVLTVALDGAPARAYPLRYLTWHEIVNDMVGDLPIAVTYCPLCNSAMVFDRRVAGEVLSFGVSGNLRHSDMIMFDRQTESWWQQAIGEGIAGVHAGAELAQLPGWLESWDSFRQAYPEGLVMAEPRGYRRPYGRNPYVGYDSSGWPFLYSGEQPPHGIDPLARVVRVGDQAWPLERLATEGSVAEAGVTITWAAGTASALDAARLAEGRDVGQIRVRDGAGRDIPHDVMFAFAFHAFWPEGIWMLRR